MKRYKSIVLAILVALTLVVSVIAPRIALADSNEISALAVDPAEAQEGFKDMLELLKELAQIHSPSKCKIFRNKARFILILDELPLLLL